MSDHRALYDELKKNTVTSMNKQLLWLLLIWVLICGLLTLTSDIDFSTLVFVVTIIVMVRYIAHSTYLGTITHINLLAMHHQPIEGAGPADRSSLNAMFNHLRNDARNSSTLKAIRILSWVVLVYSIIHYLVGVL